MAWDPSGQRLASPGDPAICIWTPGGHQAPLRIHGHDATVTAVAWRPDGQQFASVSVDHTLRIWDASNGTTDPAIDYVIGSV